MPIMVCQTCYWYKPVAFHCHAFNRADTGSQVNLMKPPEGITPYLVQLLVLGVGIALIATSGRWGDRVLVIASGVFFINIFWVTMVLGNDIRVWSFLRNSAVGNIFMVAVILGNLIYIAARAFVRLF